MNQAKTKRGSTKDLNICKESFDDKRKNNKKGLKTTPNGKNYVPGKVMQWFLENI